MAGIGRKTTGLTAGGGGDALLMGVTGEAAKEIAADPEYRKKQNAIGLEQMGASLLIAAAFFAFGALVDKFVSAIHGYARMILSAAVVIRPGDFAGAVRALLLPAVSVRDGKPDRRAYGGHRRGLHQIAAAFSPRYLLPVFVTVPGAIIGAGAIGRLAGFYFIDSAIPRRALHGQHGRHR